MELAAPSARWQSHHNFRHISERFCGSPFSGRWVGGEGPQHPRLASACRTLNLVRSMEFFLPPLVLVLIQALGPAMGFMARLLFRFLCPATPTQDSVGSLEVPQLQCPLPRSSL